MRKNVLIIEKDKSQISNGKKTLYLKGIIQEFNMKPQGRIYKEEDYLPGIKIKENNG